MKNSILGRQSRVSDKRNSEAFYTYDTPTGVQSNGIALLGTQLGTLYFKVNALVVKERPASRITTGVDGCTIVAAQYMSPSACAVLFEDLVG